MTEIAIPRPISEAAERLAHKMGIPLSEFYTAALSAYVATYQKSGITELLDQIYDTEPSAMDTDWNELRTAYIWCWSCRQTLHEVTDRRAEKS
jgi:hypothetical protein